MTIYRYFFLCLTLIASFTCIQPIQWPTLQTITQNSKQLLTIALTGANRLGKILYKHKAVTAATATIGAAALSIPKIRNTLLLLPFRAGFALARSICSPLLFVATLRTAYRLRINRIAPLQTMLAHSANLALKTDGGQTPLHVAASKGNPEVVQALLQTGANKDAQATNGRTPLHYAAESGHLAIVQALLQAGANKDTQINRGCLPFGSWTPLHLAAFNGHLEVVQLFIQAGANKDAQALLGHGTVLDIARTHHQYKIIDYLIHISELASKLLKAAHEHNIAAMRDLICKGAPATMPDEYGNTAIHISIQNNGTTNPTKDDLCLLELLRATGPIALTLRNKCGQTPLHIAAQKGNVLIATYLLRHHLKQPDQINVRDDDGNTPSHYITTRFMGKLFLHHHADLSLINKKGETPLSKFDLWKSIFTTTGLQQSAGTC